MLYRTHHPFFFHFHPFTSSSSSSFPSPSSKPNHATLSLPPPPLSSQVETEMACVEAALKTSIRKEMGMRASPQAVFDDLLDVNVQSVDFSVDDLLNFSDDDGFVVVEDQDDEKEFSSPSQHEQKQPADEETTSNDNNPCTSLFISSVPTTELTLPKEELENLEWLSHFVEESFSEFSTSFLAGVSSAEKTPNTDEKFHAEPKRFVPEKQPCFTTPIPAKARSKRARNGVRVWSLGSPSFTESSSSSTTSSSSSSSPSSPWLICATQGQEPAGSVEKPAPKKAKKRPPVESLGYGSGLGTAQPPRRCSHCGVQKTPQWRTGPLGAKTLCNACGVRFKSGRLLPEYRPACSPTFSSDLHSNHHRKVLEMRRKKEGVALPPESGLGCPVVSSF